MPKDDDKCYKTLIPQPPPPPPLDGQRLAPNLFEAIISNLIRNDL